MDTPYTTTSKAYLARQCAKDLGRHEGFAEYAYPDPLSTLYSKYPARVWGTKPALNIVSANTDMSKGNPWTVGYGFTDGVTPTSTINKFTADRKLENQILSIDALLSKTLTWYDSASFVTKTVLINMAFNMGMVGLLKFKNTLEYMKQGNWKQAAANMRKSLWYTQVTKRAEELAKRIETQKIPDEYKAPEKL